MPTIEREIKLIEAISQARVIALALSHENLTEDEILEIVESYERQFQLPTMDVLSHGCQKLVQTLGDHFPKLNQKIKRKNLEKIPVLETRVADRLTVAARNGFKDVIAWKE